MRKPCWGWAGLARLIVVAFFLLLTFPWPDSLAQTITSSGLNTTVSAPVALQSGQTQLNITGGTRPGGGGNLFHSFGSFNVPNNYIANFQNNSGLATSNILGRVTGGNVSNIFGTIQTTGFGNANLFLMNPAGFLFGPNATVNVGGMVAFTSADYLRLADGARFNALPNTAADSLLSASPVAAFGFLGSNPGAITVQGSQLTVADGTGISLVGGNITVQDGTLTAPSGPITLVSVGKPSNAKAGGEVVIGGTGSGYTPTGFKNMGAISLTEGSTINTSGIVDSAQAAGGVLIRGGQLVMDASVIIAASARGLPEVVETPGHINVAADQVTLSNSALDTSPQSGFSTNVPGNISFDVNTLIATDSAIVASGGFYSAPSGAVTIQGLGGSGTSAKTVLLTNTGISTSNFGLPANSHGVNGGPILIRAGNIALNGSSLSAFSAEQSGGTITLQSNGRIESNSSSISSNSIWWKGGTIALTAGDGLNIVDTTINAGSSFVQGGNIALSAPSISIRGGSLNVFSGGPFWPGGTITLTSTKAVSLYGTSLNANNTFNYPFLDPPPLAVAGTILINGGGLFTSQQSTISAQSALGNGGTIQMQAKNVVLTDTQLNTSTSGGPQSVGGDISVEGKQVAITNSQILSTATEGQGGTINITTKTLNKDASSVLDASSQTGVDGTVTIQKK
jgi:filamentous hemagglutinin family protein